MACLHDHSCEDHDCSSNWSLYKHIDLSKVSHFLYLPFNFCLFLYIQKLGSVELAVSGLPPVFLLGYSLEVSELGGEPRGRIETVAKINGITVIRIFLLFIELRSIKWWFQYFSLLIAFGRSFISRISCGTSYYAIIKSMKWCKCRSRWCMKWRTVIW